MGDNFNVNYNVGGKVDVVKKINLVEKIAYPEQLMPEGANNVKRKGFRIECPDDNPVTISYIAPNTGPIYLNEISVTPETNDDLDYWELEIGDEKPFETMYTMDVSDGELVIGSFEIYQKVEEGTEIKLTFHNKSLRTKRVWVTLGYIYIK